MRNCWGAVRIAVVGPPEASAEERGGGFGLGEEVRGEAGAGGNHFLRARPSRSASSDSRLGEGLPHYFALVGDEEGARGGGKCRPLAWAGAGVVSLGVLSLTM